MDVREYRCVMVFGEGVANEAAPFYKGKSGGTRLT